MIIKRGWICAVEDKNNRCIRVLTTEIFTAEQSFTIRYPNVVIKALCGNLDICLNY